jgi:prolyl-tRNA synthetase
MQHALKVTRQRFADWYQAVVREADMAESAPVRGTMIIKPWGYGVWEQLQKSLDRRIQQTGHENCYFPLFIPLSFIAKEAEHVDGFAKEMAVVTHHRLKMIDGKLGPDPSAELEEPLIVRPTSETIIGEAFSRWIRSHRDLPLLINQWANVVRWEMRPRLFLRTCEFLWQEGHTAHANETEARDETLKMLEVYREFAENVLAMPVIAGEKPENERFPGAVSTYSIEAMMQDGKALQAGTSHYLGEHFARAQNIRFQNVLGELSYCHTTSWGVSTRLVGGVIMTHGDDDGLRLPPAIAPRQVVIVPMLRDRPEDGEVVEYCSRLSDALSQLRLFGEPVRVLVDTKPVQSAEKRWNWVRRGAPIICEIGARDASNGQVSFVRRDDLRSGEKIKTERLDRDNFIERCVSLLTDVQKRLFTQAKTLLEANIRNDFRTFDEIADYFGSDDEENTGAFKGWVRVPWSRPTGDALDAVEHKLKALKLTLRNIPMARSADVGRCVFTGAPGAEDILIARAY